MNSSDQNNPSENNSSRNNKSKKGKGRQKVNMVKIENETNLQVTFSKRRAGLFKKASELSTLCGAESAIVVFSPGEKAHSFGNPSVETIANRFLNQNNNVPPRNEHTEQLLRAHSEANMRQHNQELIHIEAQLELEKKRKQELDNMTKQNHSWCLPNIDELNYQELDQLKRSVMSFKQNFETKVQDATNLVNSSYVQEPNHETGFPLDSHFQGSNQIALFEAGASSSNLGFPTNPGGNSSGISFFPDYMNSSSGVNVSPFDPMNGNNFGMTVQYPHLATNSDGILPYNYGNPNDIVPYGIGTRNNELEHETHNNGQNKWQGSSSNYGRRGI